MLVTEQISEASEAQPGTAPESTISSYYHLPNHRLHRNGRCYKSRSNVTRADKGRLEATQNKPTFALELSLHSGKQDEPYTSSDASMQSFCQKH